MLLISHDALQIAQGRVLSGGYRSPFLDCGQRMLYTWLDRAGRIETNVTGIIHRLHGFAVVGSG